VNTWWKLIWIESVGAGRSERLDHVLIISTHRDELTQIENVGYGSEMWLRGVRLLVSEASATAGLTAGVML